MNIDVQRDIDSSIDMDTITDTDIDSRKLEHGCRMIYAGVPLVFGVGLEDGHVSNFWLLP